MRKERKIRETETAEGKAFHHSFTPRFLATSQQIKKQTLTTYLFSFLFASYLYANKNSNDFTKDSGLLVFLFTLCLQILFTAWSQLEFHRLEKALSSSTFNSGNYPNLEKQLTHLKETTTRFHRPSYLLLPTIGFVLAGPRQFFDPESVHKNLFIAFSHIFTYAAGKAHTQITRRRSSKMRDTIYASLIDGLDQTEISGVHFNLSLGVKKSEDNTLAFTPSLSETKRNTLQDWAKIPPRTFFAKIIANILAKHFGDAYWGFRFPDSNDSLTIQVIDKNNVDLNIDEIRDEIKKRLEIALAIYEFNSRFIKMLYKGISFQDIELSSTKLSRVTITYAGQTLYSQTLAADTLYEIQDCFEFLKSSRQAEGKTQRKNETVSLPPALFQAQVRNTDSEEQSGPARPKQRRAVAAANADDNSEYVVPGCVHEVDFGDYGRYKGNEEDGDYTQIRPIEQLYGSDRNCKYYWTCTTNLARLITKNDLPFELAIAHRRMGAKGVILNVTKTDELFRGKPVIAKYKDPGKDLRIIATEAAYLEANGTKHILIRFSAKCRHADLFQAPLGTKPEIEELAQRVPRPR